MKNSKELTAEEKKAIEILKNRKNSKTSNYDHSNLWDYLEVLGADNSKTAQTSLKNEIRDTIKENEKFSADMLTILKASQWIKLNKNNPKFQAYEHKTDLSK